MTTTETAIPAGFEPVMPVGFNAYVGPLLRDTAKAPGEAGRFVFTPQFRHMNGGGGVHGGMLMTIADVFLGYTVREAVGEKAISTVALNCDFVGMAKQDERIEVKTQITRQTRSLVFVSCELSVGARIVLTATGIWKVLGQ